MHTRPASCASPTKVGAPNDAIQAEWLLSLVEDLERYATTCIGAACKGHVTSGGSLMAWTDELWKGRVIEATDIHPHPNPNPNPNLNPNPKPSPPCSRCCSVPYDWATPCYTTTYHGYTAAYHGYTY